MDTTKSAYWLNEKSPLLNNIASFAPRTSQIELAGAIEDAINLQQILIAEAGTGTGKTFAYLIPALLSGKKTIVSTGTKTLQDQLYFRDIPALRRGMSIPAKVSLLKGRSNYICLHRLEHTEQQLFPSKEVLKHLQQIKQSVPKTRYGDINEIKHVPENSPVWYYVTSTVDNCLGAECPSFEDCYLVKARRKAMTADLVVINHHLLFADVMLKEEGVGEILPTADLLVIDEAHQIPEIASQFLGVRFSSRQITELIKDSILEQTKEATSMMGFRNFCDALEIALTDFRLLLGDSQIRAAWDTSPSVLLTQAIQALMERFELFSEQLKLLAPMSKSLEMCWQRCEELKILLQQVTTSGAKEFIHWYETFHQSFSIYLTPLSIAEPFRALVDARPKAWVFTSATLTVNEKFDLFKQQLGLFDAKELLLQSPFAYEENCLLYVPRNLPDPNSSEYVEAVVRAAIPLIKQNKGRTFFLFTSHRALRQASELLSTQIDYPLFIQGQEAKDQLLKDFVNHGYGVLLGTYSFWEGVDVRGATLSCVIIDKLPFQSPEDPVGVARANALKAQGKNAFFEDQLPKSVLSLKQGSGRLIRDVDDMGVIMIADPRLVARDYGKIFLASLPNMQRTRNEKTVLSFIQHMHRSAHESISD